MSLATRPCKSVSSWCCKKTPIPTPTVTVTPTVTQTSTPTLELTPTLTPTLTATITSTLTPTPTVTQTNTPTLDLTPTPTSTETPTNTPTSTLTPTNTPTSTLTPTNTLTSTLEPTPSNTPTQTVTPTTLCCYQYEVTNYYTTAKTVYYTDCNGTPSSISCAGNGLQTYINCALEGSLTTNDTICDNSSTDCITWTAANTPCGGCVPPSQTPTNTPTNTPTPTLTPTNTIAPTSTPTNTPTNTLTPTQTVTPTTLCCYQYEVTNYYTSSKIVYYTDCNGTPSSISCAGNGLQTYINCALEGSVFTNDVVCDNSNVDCITWVEANTPCGGCVPPSQTPTNTPTNTPTLTSTPTNTTATTSTPTNTPTNTLTPTLPCECYYYDVITYEQDILRATGNTGPNEFRNGLVWVTYRNCDDSGFTDATFDNTASPYQNAICVNGLPQYNPPTIFIWQDNVQTTEILSFVQQGGCCTTPPTPTPTVTQSLTPTSSIAPTSTPTQTNTPTQVASYAFCLGYDTTDCAAACTDYNNCNN